MSARPNFLLIYTDQQRFDAVGANGNEAIRTPHTDRLAAEGANFANMFVASPNCMSSRAAFATGRYPHVNGVRWNGMALPRSETTFMQLLADAGYETALYGKLHLWPHQSRSADDPTFGFGIANIAENLRTHAHSAYRAWLAEHYPDHTDLDIRTLRTARWKLTHYAGRPFGELFDLQEDPGEIVNRWDDPGCRGVRAELTAALVERMAQAEAPVPERLDIA